MNSLSQIALRVCKFLLHFGGNWKSWVLLNGCDLCKKGNVRLLLGGPYADKALALDQKLG